jgi:signal transduction histidine kinase/ActR/RegA family two-component response regulator
MKERPFNVLLIEGNAADERKVRAMLADSASFKFNCHSEDSMEDGLARLSDGDWDVVLLDLAPAGDQRRDMFFRFNSNAPRLPIILLAGGDDPEVASGPIPQGAQDLLNKAHLDAGLLSQAIYNAIHRKRAEEDQRELTENLISINSRLKETQAELVNSERLAAVGRLAAGVAHQINNPAAFVLSNLGTLQRSMKSLLAIYHECRQALMDTAPQDRVRKFLEKEAEAEVSYLEQDTLDLIEESLDGMKRIRDIVSSLQSFAATGKAERTQLDLNEILESVLTILQNQVEYKAVLVKELNPAPLIAGDRAKLAQVFLNLILNAVHAVPEGDRANNRILVRSEAVGEAVMITISDTGSGIAPESMPFIFDPFFTTRPLGQAAGLGLTIAREIVRQHQGRIEVSSDPGHGSFFRVYLPAASAEAAEFAPAAPKSAPMEKRITARILIVDDEPHILRACQRALPITISAVTAGSGGEALAIIKRDSDFDVIVCDLMMPDLSGIEVYNRVVKEKPGLAGRFLFVTGGAYTEKTVEFTRHLQHPLLKKPFSTGELVDAIEKVMKTEGLGSS